MRRLWGALLTLLIVIAPALTSTFSTVAEAKPVAIDEEGVHVALELDGVVMTGLTIRGALEVAAAGDAGACAAGGVCTQLVSQALDELERITAGITDRSRHDTVKNSIGNIRARMADLSQAIGDLDGDGYPDTAAKPRPGQPVFGTLTIRREGLKDRSLYDWFQKAAAGETDRKSGSVIFLDREGQEIARYAFSGAQPVSWRLETEAGIVEEIELAVEKVERAAAARSGAGATEESLPPSRYPVHLLVDGAVVARFESASLAATLPGPDDDCDGTAESACLATLALALDQLEAAVREAAPANQAQISRLIGQMRAPLTELDAALKGARRPGPARFSHIVLKRGLTGSEIVGRWTNEVVLGKPWKRNVALRVVGPNGQALIEIDLGESEWVHYAVTGTNGLAVESVELKFIRMELK